jgi:hypothetical protein
VEWSFACVRNASLWALWAICCVLADRRRSSLQGSQSGSQAHKRQAGTHSTAQVLVPVDCATYARREDGRMLPILLLLLLRPGCRVAGRLRWVWFGFCPGALFLGSRCKVVYRSRRKGTDSTTWTTRRLRCFYLRWAELGDGRHTN